MHIYLYRENDKYISYWMETIKETTKMNVNNLSSINENDILVIDNSLYSNSLGINAKLLVLDNEPSFATSVLLLQDGVKAYGNVYMHHSHILSAIESLRDNKIWMYPDFIAKMIALSSVSETIDLEKKVKILTPREKEIALLILDGLTNKEVAIKLDISANTIKNHTKNIYTKLDVTDRLSLFCLLK